MNFKMTTPILVLIILMFIIVDSIGQNITLPKPVGTINSLEGSHKLSNNSFSSFEEGSDFIVIDGILLNLGENINNKLDIISVKQIKSKDKLNQLGVHDSNKIYTFYNSNVTPFHEYIYRRTETPLEWGTNVPIIINGKIILPDEYEKMNLLDTNSVVKTLFLPKNNPLLEDNKKVVYGAIAVTVK